MRFLKSKTMKISINIKSFHLLCLFTSALEIMCTNHVETLDRIKITYSRTMIC